MTEEEDDDKPFKINCKCCNVFLRRDGKRVELLYITSIHAGMSIIGLYHQELNP